MSFGGPPPGGFGGPPPDGGGFGGPPPGGGFGGPPGGPPPGGPPPGGGYGPPPGGGFGGPPQGGFGGPPQGGPFGGPPQGGPFGPPPGGGFGGPQVGFGAPIPPQKSGTSVGMIVGIGCGALALLGIVGTVVGMLMVRRAATSAPPPAYSPPPVAAPTPTKAGGSGALKSELKELTAIKSKYGKSTRFIGEILNTGADPIGYPSAKVTFYDSAGTAVDSGTCTSLIRVLRPTEKVPCAFSIFKGLDWANYKIELTPYPPSFQGEEARIDITDIKFTPKRGYQPDTLEGKLTNKSSFKAKNVWAIVSLYDANKKIIGADNTLVAGNDLEAGTSGLFTAKVYEVAGTPDSYQVLAVGYSQ